MPPIAGRPGVGVSPVHMVEVVPFARALANAAVSLGKCDARVPRYHEDKGARILIGFVWFDSFIKINLLFQRKTLDLKF